MYRDSDFTPHEANNHLRLGIADARRHLGLTPKSSFHRELPSTVVLCALWAGVTIPRESVLEFQATGAHSPTLLVGPVWGRPISVTVLGDTGQSVL